MDHKIRVANKADESSIRSLFIEMLKTIYDTDDVKGYDKGYLDSYWTDGEDRIYVADDGRVVAYLSVEVHHDENDYIYIDDLSVTEEYRNKEIGTELIKKAESYAREIKIPAVLFHVEKTNKDAMRLYERLGYEIFRDDNTRFLLKKDL
ncbi:MAG: GNAT family N-acetyltransferase [Lachnospiraceae bacterium]|nr:GNAT family N-acetyltransferase [Lachnospiraceae bacterium]